MLILGRKVGESIIIGDNITIEVCGIHGHQIRIGIEAPKDISVHRREVYERIQEQNLTSDKEIDTNENSQ